MKILIIDANPNYIHMLKGLLTHQVGFDVNEATSIQLARMKWEWKPDVVIIDPAFDEQDGLNFCREMQDTHDPLILAMNKSEDDAAFLERGADAYLQKPFHPEQVLAHIHALARRPVNVRAILPTSLSVVSTGRLGIDPALDIAFTPSQRVSLTPIECRLAWRLVQGVGQVCTYEDLLSHTWGPEGGDGDALKTHMNHLRKKLGLFRENVGRIRTWKHSGYEFEEATQ